MLVADAVSSRWIQNAQRARINLLSSDLKQKKWKGSERNFPNLAPTKSVVQQACEHLWGSHLVVFGNVFGAVHDAVKDLLWSTVSKATRRIIHRERVIGNAAVSAVRGFYLNTCRVVGELTHKMHSEFTTKIKPEEKIDLEPSVDRIGSNLDPHIDSCGRIGIRAFGYQRGIGGIYSRQNDVTSNGQLSLYNLEDHSPLAELLDKDLRFVKPERINELEKFTPLQDVREHPLIIVLDGLVAHGTENIQPSLREICIIDIVKRDYLGTQPFWVQEMKNRKERFLNNGCLSE